MDFNKLADVFDERGNEIERWADRAHEYKIAAVLHNLADDIRAAVSKAEDLK